MQLKKACPLYDSLTVCVCAEIMARYATDEVKKNEALFSPWMLKDFLPKMERQKNSSEMLI